MPTQGSCGAPMLALLALSKISELTDFGFASQNLPGLVHVCAEKQDWEADLRSHKFKKNGSQMRFLKHNPVPTGAEAAKLTAS